MQRLVSIDHQEQSTNAPAVGKMNVIGQSYPNPLGTTPFDGALFGVVFLAVVLKIQSLHSALSLACADRLAGWSNPPGTRTSLNRSLTEGRPVHLSGLRAKQQDKKNKNGLTRVFFWLGAAWVKSRAERPSVSEVN